MKRTANKLMTTGTLKSIYLLLSVALFIPLLPAAAGQRVALSLGISQYSEYPALSVAASDAKAISKSLSSRGFDQVNTLTDDNVTASSMRSALTKISRNLTAGDLLVVYIAAHGWVDQSDGRAVILPGKTRHGFERTDGIDLNTVIKRIASHTPAKIVVVVDACYAGAFRLPGDNNQVTFWAAAREKEQAFEGKESGLFTGQLLKHLETSSTHNIASLVNNSVKKETGGWQVPELFGQATHSALALL